MKLSHSHLDCTESTIKQLIIEPAIKKMEESYVWAVYVNLRNTQEGLELSYRGPPRKGRMGKK